MKVDEKKKYQDFINEVYVPVIVFNYSTGTIIAMNSGSRKMFGNRLSNVNELIGKASKLWSMTQNGEYSLIEYDVAVKERFSKQSYDCEYNVIYTSKEKKDSAIVVMIIEYSYRDLFRDDYSKLAPRLYWNYVENNMLVEDGFYVSSSMKKRIKDIFKTVRLADVKYALANHEIEEFDQTNLRIINTRMPEPGTVRILDVDGLTVFSMLRKIPVVSTDDNVCCILTMIKESVSTQRMVEMIDAAFYEKNVVNEIVNDGDSIYVVFIMDDERIIKYCSPNVDKLGYKYRILKNGNTCIDELIESKDIERFKGNLQLIRDDDKENTELLSEYSFMKNDKSTVKMSVKMVKKSMTDGQKICNLVITPSTKRRKTKGVLYDDGIKAEKYLGIEKIIENAATCILVLNSNDYKIIRVNKLTEQTFAGRESLIGMDIFMFYEKFNIEKQGPYLVDVKKKRYYVFSRSKKNEGKERDIIVVTFMDVTDIVKNQNAEGVYDNVDTITGIRTRVELEEDIIRAVKKSMRLDKKSALLALDIDNFKSINAKYGYDTGDRILEKLGAALEGNRHFHNHCYRTNGDMFFIVVDCEYNLDLIVKEAMDTGNSLRPVEDEDVKITVSCGVTLFPDEYYKTDTIIDCSVSALSRAKRMGRSKWTVFKYLKGQEAHKRFLTDKLLKEFKENYGAFEVYYEPVSDIRGDKVTGARATIKWYDERMGNIDPYKYIEVPKMDAFEFLKYIVPVNELLVKSALEMCKHINDKYDKNFKMYVKASVFLLAREDFIIGFERLIKMENINPANIIVDVSEGYSVNDYLALNIILHTLHRIGCKVLVRESFTSNFDTRLIDKLNVDCVCLNISELRKKLYSGADKKRKFERLCEKYNSEGISVIIEGVSSVNANYEINKITDVSLTGEVAGKTASASDFMKIYIR